MIFLYNIDKKKNFDILDDNVILLKKYFYKDKKNEIRKISIN